jgi:hypothetical protein
MENQGCQKEKPAATPLFIPTRERSETGGICCPRCETNSQKEKANLISQAGLYNHGARGADKTMAMKIAFQLIPLERLSSPAFDFSQLPYSIMQNVEVADVSQLLPPSMFEYMKSEVGRHRLRFFDGTVKHALVHRYEDHPEADTFEESERMAKRNENLINEIFACSRIVRPTRRHGSVRGRLNPDGTVNHETTNFPDTALDVPEALKLFAFRNKDLQDLRELISQFLTAIRGEYWPFRMALQYYHMGYEVNDWKGRYLYWGSSALHALYSPSSEKLVRRIRSFLGEQTPIYPADEHPEFEFMKPETITVGDVVDDINCVRNCIAHGERIPDKYFGINGGRTSLSGKVNYISVLDDALAFIVRRTLRRILEENLLDGFTSRHAVSLFWKSRNL